MKQIERQDIKSAIYHLKEIEKDLNNYGHCSIEYIITMLEDLSNLVCTLQQENAKLKQDVLQLEAMIDD